MESKKWLLLLLHAFIVCCGLVVEEFYPAVRTMLCSPILHDLFHHDPPSSDNLTARVGLNIGLEPIIQRLETNSANLESWGDYPEDSHPHIG
jgi:hypothetical protein